ncbi:MAG: class I SAM-dependent methyltransferase [Thermomicrobiales bacterium]
MKISDQMLDPHHLRTSQYKDDRHLLKRIAIHQRFGTSSQVLYHWLFSQIDFPLRPRVLELGCGNGLFWSENVASLPAQLSLTLTDLSPGMIAEARSRLGKAIPHDALVAQAQSLPFADNTFDIVIANYMLYHVPNTAAAIDEIRRVLASGGRLYAATNGVHHMHDLLQLAPWYDANERVTSHFALENGAKQLERRFDAVQRRDFEDNLEITEVQPVIDYLESAAPEGGLSAEDVIRITDIVTGAIQRDGAFHVRKSTGVLIAG